MVRRWRLCACGEDRRRRGWWGRGAATFPLCVSCVRDLRHPIGPFSSGINHVGNEQVSFCRDQSLLTRVTLFSRVFLIVMFVHMFTQVWESTVMCRHFLSLLICRDESGIPESFPRPRFTVMWLPHYVPAPAIKSLLGWERWWVLPSHALFSSGWGCKGWSWSLILHISFLTCNQHAGMQSTLRGALISLQMRMTRRDIRESFWVELCTDQWRSRA